MLNVTPRLKKIAEKVLDNALPIKRGQAMVFYAGTENLKLAYAFAAECEKRGIETLIQTEGDYVRFAKLLEAPIATFARTPKFPTALVEAADWYILMTGTRYDNSPAKKQENQQRLMEFQRLAKWTNDSLLQLCLKKKKHLVAFLDPNKQQAEALGKTYEETLAMFLDSLDIDYKALTALGKKIIRRMNKGGEIHLTSPNGTDLTFHAEGRPWGNDDGKPNPPNAQVTQYIHNLPVGEVFVAPIETSAQGVIYPKSMPGSMIQDITIRFHGKQKAEITAQKGSEHLEARLERATGNPYSIAEFAFGTNPCGNMLLATEKAFGTCHVAVGQNVWLGGKNDSSIHWDFLIEDPTVTIGEKTILRNGKFRL
jgi:leucyl aminopeptidase (aminopeptidase T)